MTKFQLINKEFDKYRIKYKDKSYNVRLHEIEDYFRIYNLNVNIKDTLNIQFNVSKEINKLPHNIKLYRDSLHKSITKENRQYACKTYINEEYIMDTITDNRKHMLILVYRFDLDVLYVVTSHNSELHNIPHLFRKHIVKDNCRTLFMIDKDIETKMLDKLISTYSSKNDIANISI